MSKFLKMAVAAIAVSLSVAPASLAFASAGEHASCEASSITPHGVWDCH